MKSLIPFKFISQFTGVNYTGNLDIIRTSPDHGTAFNLAGKNRANPKSLVNAIKQALIISENRKNK